jgi:apolipoprotein N-acyltransferase
MALEPRVMRMLRQHDKVIILPESVVGYWYSGTQAIWSPVLRWTASHDQDVLIGAEVVAGHGYVDAIVLMHHGHETVLADRVPVPVGMWHPWRPVESAREHFFGPAEQYHIMGVNFGYSICYEELLMWPELSLIGTHAQILLGLNNDWWARGTDIGAIQKQSLRLWGDLLNVPVIFAVNS